MHSFVIGPSEWDRNTPDLRTSAQIITTGQLVQISEVHVVSGFMLCTYCSPQTKGRPCLYSRPEEQVYLNVLHTILQYLYLLDYLYQLLKWINEECKHWRDVHMFTSLVMVREYLAFYTDYKST